MAELGKIRIIKDNTGGSGIPADPTGGTGATTKGATASATSAASDIIKDNTGGSGVTVTIVNTVTGEEIIGDQPFYKELCLHEGDLVHYEVISRKGITPYATNISRLMAGTVVKIDAGGNSGVLTERKSGMAIPFYHQNLAVQRIKEGDDVRYRLVRSSAGVVTAVNLHEIV